MKPGYSFLALIAAATALGGAGSARGGTGASGAPQAAPSADRPASAPVTAQAAIPAPDADNGFLKLSFDRLAGYRFVPPDFDPVANPKVAPPSGEEQIPPIVKSWSGKKAVVTGYMLPTKLESGKATEFLLMANQMACCYGTVPNMNDWVIVRIPKGTPIVQDVPIAFRGTFKVGAQFENGYMTGIYQLDAEGDGQVAE